MNNIMDAVIKHCLSSEANKQEIECFQKNWAPFIYLIDKQKYWKIVEDIKAIHNFTLKTILAKKEEQNILDEDNDYDLDFKLIERVCFFGDAEQKKQISTKINRVYVNRNDNNYVKISGELHAGFSIDCDMNVTFYNKNKETIKGFDYFRLFAEEQGVFEIDLFLSVSKEIMRSDCEMEIVCKYT